jgi:hypothetical protein
MVYEHTVYTLTCDIVYYYSTAIIVLQYKFRSRLDHSILVLYLQYYNKSFIKY